MFTERIAYSEHFFQAQVPRTKRYLLYIKSDNGMANDPFVDFPVEWVLLALGYTQHLQHFQFHLGENHSFRCKEGNRFHNLT